MTLPRLCVKAEAEAALNASSRSFYSQLSRASSEIADSHYRLYRISYRYRAIHICTKVVLTTVDLKVIHTVLTKAHVSKVRILSYSCTECTHIYIYIYTALYVLGMCIYIQLYKQTANT